MDTSVKLCPTCNTENESTASVCWQCGTLLEENATKLISLTQNMGKQSKVSAEDAESFIDSALIPEGGIGIYAAGGFKPFYLKVDKILIIGRKTEETEQDILDLSELGAYNMGVSRHHAVIRRTDSGFEVADLSSRNGTWLKDRKSVV